MITYLYFFFVLALCGGAIYLIGVKLKQWMPAMVVSTVLALSFGSFYYFYLQQMFVKRWGGVMSIQIPKGQHHVATTWKDDNIWVENYDPATNTCIFQEYSRGNVLQGKVLLKDCNPIALRGK